MTAISRRPWTFRRDHPAHASCARQSLRRALETDGPGNEEGEPDALSLWEAAP